MVIAVQLAFIKFSEFTRILARIRKIFRRPGSSRMTLLCDSPPTVQYIYKAYGLIELDRRLNSPFTRPSEQRWLLLCSWFSKILAHFARLPSPRSAPKTSDFLAPMVLKSTVMCPRIWSRLTFVSQPSSRSIERENVLRDRMSRGEDGKQVGKPLKHFAERGSRKHWCVGRRWASRRRFQETRSH